MSKIVDTIHPTQKAFYKIAVSRCKKNKSRCWCNKGVRFKLNADGDLLVKCTIVSAWALCVFEDDNEMSGV